MAFQGCAGQLDTGTKLGRSENAMSGAPSSVRQKESGLMSATTTNHDYGPQGLVDLQLWKKAKQQAKKAIKEKKIFAVQGPYPIIRRLLRARGWVERKLPCNGRQLKVQVEAQEKRWLETEPRGDGAAQGKAVLEPHGKAQLSLRTMEPLQYPCPQHEEKEEKEEEEENMDPDGIHKFMSYLVQDQVPNFLWTLHLSTIDQDLLRQIKMVNHHSRVHALSTKEGLCLSLQNLPWFEEANPHTFFPRCYRLGIIEEEEDFIEDFRLTAARSLLKLALEKAGDKQVEQPPKHNKGRDRPKVPFSIQLVEEAMEVCKQHLDVLGHQDIDRKTPSPYRTRADWDHFLQGYYRVAHEGAGLALSAAQREQCQSLLQCLAERLPQLSMEGNLNIWILKPSAKSQGKGIVCLTQLEEVLQIVRSCTTRSVRGCEWVVQKYVERLLTIFGTKFDIRQWFLVTDGNPLTIWFYRDCYLRFCSQPFSLSCLDHSRHLCNVAVQKKYKPSPLQDPRVPPDRIWSNQQFQAYLARLGRADVWHEVVVPGMKAAIVNSVRCAQEHVGFRRGSFELYGADFLIGEDCQPWLLEINSCPSMSPSSTVTRRLCANVQQDTLRLVLDHKDNPSCSTGAFELIYKGEAVPPHLTLEPDLMVQGHSLKKPQPAKLRSQTKPLTAGLSARQLTLLPRSKATKIPRVAQEKLPPLRQKSSCCPPSSCSATLRQSSDCSARRQELPQLLPGGLPQEDQPQEAQPQAALTPINSHPLDRVPVSPPQEASAWSAWSQELQPQEALPPIKGHPLAKMPVANVSRSLQKSLATPGLGSLLPSCQATAPTSSGTEPGQEGAHDSSQ